MHQPQRYASLRDYLDVIRRRRILVSLVTVLVTGGALLYSALTDPTYRAEATLSFREPTEGSELIGLPFVRGALPEQRAAVGAELASQRDTLEAVKRRLRIPGPYDDFAERVSARAEVRTNLVIVTAEDTTAEGAARIANEVADEASAAEREDTRRGYQELIATTRRELRALRGRDRDLVRTERLELRRRLAQLETVRDYARPVDILQRARVPVDPVAPRPLRNTLIGFFGGLLVGILLAFLREALDRRLRSTREIIDESSLPLLGVVREEALGTGTVPDPLDLEAFRILRTNLEYLDVDRAAQVVLVTSSLPDEGKSSVAGGLAQASALAGKRVALVGCDLRRPVLAARLGLEESPGLTDFLAGRAAPGETVRLIQTSDGLPAVEGEERPVASMALIPAGSIAPQPAELLRSDRFAGFIGDLRDVYDLIVVDSAPLLSVVDTLELIKHVDAVVLCVRSGRTTRDHLRAALQTMQRFPDRPTGLMVTAAEPGVEGQYGYYSYAYSQAT